MKMLMIYKDICRARYQLFGIAVFLIIIKSFQYENSQLKPIIYSLGFGPVETSRNNNEPKTTAATKATISNKTTRITTRFSNSSSKDNNRTQSATSQPDGNLTYDSVYHEMSSMDANETTTNVTTKTTSITISNTSSQDTEKKRALPSQPDGYDTMAPMIYGAVTHLLPSLVSADVHRVPVSQIEEWLMEKNKNGSSDHKMPRFQNFRVGVDPDQFMIYNPSIVALPRSLSEEEEERATITTTSTETNGNEGIAGKPVYLASYRLSSVHSCGFSTYEFWKKGRNVFGFALLDKNLRIVPNTDVVVDMLRHMGKKSKTRKSGISFDPEDVRLFRLRDRIYISTYTKLIQIAVNSSSYTNMMAIYSSTSSNESSTISSNNTDIGLQLLPNMYGGDNLQIYTIGEVLQVAFKGKNFQFFVPPETKSDEDQINNNKVSDNHLRGNHSAFGNNTDTNTIDNKQDSAGNSAANTFRVLMEGYPSGPREVLEFDLSYKGSEIPIFKKYRTSNENKIKKPNNRNLEAYYNSTSRMSKLLINRDRGTACCTRIISDHYRDLLPPLPVVDAGDDGKGDDKNVPNEISLHDLDSVFVGVSHRKSRNRMPAYGENRERFVYLSKMYAFSPYAPYHIVAESEYFCLGPSTREDRADQGVEADPYAKFMVNKTMASPYNSKRFQCTDIHFVSGLTDKVGDENNTAIIAYGESDCVSRMGFLDKRELALKLFPSR